MKRFKTLASEAITKCLFWEAFKDKVELKNGKTGDYFYVKTRGCSMVVPVLPDGRLLLVNQYRYLSDRTSIEFPCGGLEENEMPLAGARRELLEETGYDGDDLAKIGSFFPANGFAKDECHVFLGLVQSVGQVALDDFEELEVIVRRPDEFEEMVRRGEIWQGHTLAAWSLAREHVFKFIKEYGLQPNQQS